MYGVTFDGVHFGDTTDFIMNYARVGIPEPKIKEIEVPGRNGVLDITESLGTVKYASREILFRFTTHNQDKIDLFYSGIHGQKKQIILDKEPAFYYTGRCRITNSQISGLSTVLDVTAKCDPYKLKIRKTIHKEVVNGSTNIVLLNERMQVIPEISVTDKLTLEFGNKTYKMEAGTYSFADIVLNARYNKFRVHGSGIITFTYQEGAL